MVREFSLKTEVTSALRREGTLFSYILPSHGLEGTHGDGGESFWTMKMRAKSQEWGAGRWQEPGSPRLWSCLVGPGLLTVKRFRREINCSLIDATAILGLLQQPNLYSTNTRHLFFFN